MLSDVYKLLESDQQYYMIYKSRGIHNLISGSQVKAEADRLVNHKRVMHFEQAPFDYQPWHIMGICDLVIGAFTSSAPLESVAGGVKTVCYVPSERFNKQALIINTFGRFCAYGYQQLKGNVEYWLKQCSQEDFGAFQDKYIKRYVDSFCDGRAGQRLRSLLMIEQANQPRYQSPAVRELEAV
jgi:hypothetical protein